jgi:peptidyl-prolyl cis-trans isomerase A (cyclophilin A)
MLLPLVAAVPAFVVAAAQAPRPRPALTDVAAFNETAPDVYRVLFATSAGSFAVRVTRAWSPHAADRFYNLVRNGFYDDCRFFRVVPKFMAQFGIHGDPAVSAAWKDATLPAERARVSNTRGRLAFAQGLLASSRTTQVFISYGDNSRLDKDGFAPFGEVITSMLIVERLYSEYGEGPEQSAVQAGGNLFLNQYLPKLSYITSATVEPPASAGTPARERAPRPSRASRDGIRHPAPDAAP